MINKKTTIDADRLQQTGNMRILLLRLVEEPGIGRRRVLARGIVKALAEPMAALPGKEMAIFLPSRLERRHQRLPEGPIAAHRRPHAGRR